MTKAAHLVQSKGERIIADSYNKGWKLGNHEPIKDTVNIYENKGYTDLTYKRFRVYLNSYIISFIFFIILLYKLISTKKAQQPNKAPSSI